MVLDISFEIIGYIFDRNLNPNFAKSTLKNYKSEKEVCVDRGERRFWQLSMHNRPSGYQEKR